MKVDRKTKAEKSPPAARKVKSSRRSGSAPKTNGKHPLIDYEHIPIGVVETSLEGKYADVNEEFCRILGYSKNELLRLGIKDCTHEEDYGIDSKLYEQLIAGQIPFYRLEKRFVQKSGGIIWVELTRTLVCDVKGKPLYAVGVVLDISDRKDVEKVLRESVERLRLATETARMFMWEWDFQNYSYILADNFEQVLGFSANLLPKNSFDTIGKLIPAEDVQAISEAFESAVQQQRDLHTVACRAINPETGQLVWLEVSAKIVYDRQRKPERMFGVAQNITESKKVQDEIAIISRMPEENPNPVMRLRPDGSLLYANDPSRAMLDLWKQQGNQTIPPELQKSIEEAFASGVKKEIEITQNGRTFSCTLAPILDAGYINFYGNDITRRKQAEESLRSSEERMRLAIEANRMVAWEWDPEGDHVMTSENVSEVYGLDSVDKAAAGFALIWEEDLPAHKEKVEHVTREGGEYHSEFRVTRPVDGRVLWMEERATALTDANGRVTRLAGVVTDITERKLAEEKLRESEERLRALVSQATAGIAQNDIGGRLTFVNPKFCEMLGYTEEELLGRTIWEITYVDDLEENKRLFQRMLEQGEPYQFEKRFIRRDGSTRWTNVSVTSIHDAAGKPKGDVSVMIDIEERKQAEQALAEFARQQAALYRLSEQLHRADSAVDVYDAALDAILRALQCDRASILLYDNQDVMRFVAWRGLSDEYRKAADGHSPWTPDEKDPQPITMDDVRTADLDESLRAVIEGEGIGALAFIPLVVNGKLIGKFMIYFNKPHTFHEGELDLSLTIAHQLAFGVDRNRTEQALKSERELLERLVETMPVIVSMIDPATGSMRMNAEFERQIGWKSEEVTTVSLLEALYPDLDYRNDVLQRMAAANKNEWVEVQVRTRDGRIMDSLWSNVSIFKEDGTLAMGIALGIDITERKQAEKRLALLAEISEMLRNVEDPYELMYAISSSLGQHLNVKRVLFNEIDLDHDREIVHRDYHKGLESVAGVHKVSDYSSITSEEAASGKTVVNVDSKTDPRTAQDYERTYAQSGERSYVVVPMMRDNRWVASLWVSDDAPRQWSSEEVSLLETVAERTWAIVEKMRINTALRESEQRYRAVVESQAEMLCRFRPDGTILFANHAYARARDTTPEELTNRNFWEFITEADRASVKDMLDSLTPQAPQLQIENRFQTVEGDRWTLWTNRALKFDEQGRLLEAQSSGIDITERKQAEEALRSSEERMRLATDAAGMYAWELNAEHQNVTLSENFAEVVGFSADLFPENIIEALERLSPAEDARIVQDAMARAFERQEDLRDLQYRMVNPETGQEIWVEVNARTIYDSEGNPQRMYGVSQNITERKRIEESLRLENERFLRFVDSNIVGILIGNASGNVILANDYYLRLLGVTRQEFDEGKVDWKKFTPPEWLPADEKAIRELRESGVCEPYEKEYVRADGTRVPVYIADAMLPGPRDEIAAFVLDITERKRADEALRESEERYRGIVNQTIAGIAETDLTGKFIMVNDRYCEIAGYARESLLHEMQMQEITHPDDLQKNLEMFGRLAADGSPFEIEKRYVRQDGSVVWVHNSVSAITNADGKPQSAVAAVIDVTERKRAEETLRRNEEMLSTLVEAAPFGVYFIDSEFRLRAINKGAEAVFSNIDPLIGRDFAEILRIIWQESFATEAIERFRHTLRTGESFISPPIIEERANIEDIQSYDWQIHRITMPDGTYGVVCYFYDLSEQKRMEATVRASESLYRAIARNIPGGGVYVVDKDFRYLVAEGPVTEAFGLTRDILEGHTVTEVFPDERGKQMEDQLRRNFAGETVSFETRFNERVYWTQQAPLHESIGEVIILTLDITERKLAEEALRQSEERFARFMHHLPGLAWIKDTEGRYVYANTAAEQAFNTRREKLYGSTDEDIFPPEVAAQFKVNDEQALTDEKGVQVIEILEHADGVLHYSLVNKFPIPGPDGTATLIGGTAFDITERLQAEEALRESEERFRAILRQATAGIVRKDAQGRLIFVNEAFCNMLGYTEAELLGRPMWDFMHKDDIAENKRSYERLMMEGIPFKLERRLIREDGSIIWMDASVSPILDADGKPQSAVAVEVDITGRKLAEEALRELNAQLEDRVLSRTARLRAVNQTLREEIAERKRVEEALRKSEATARENEEKLSTLFELLPVGISFLDLHGQIIQMNSALANILKLSKQELLDQNYKSRTYIRSNGTLMHPAEFASRRALTEGKTIYNVETGVVLENSEVIWTSVSAAPVAVADVGAVVVTADITESKRAERALQESRERLQILSQRLVEVQEEERRAIARELHDRVGQTLAALNINLIIISGQLGDKVDEQISTRLSDSMKLVAETISLVRDVMSNLRPSVLDDYGLEAAIESHLSQFMSRYEIQVKFEKPDQPVPRLGSSIEMTFLRIAQESLMNIARHAQATQVDLSLQREDEMISMMIQDNGIGIQSWQDANHPGSHGLTIMRERAEAFGGTLNVSSVPGQGTRVEVRIPVENNSPPQTGQEMHS